MKKGCALALATLLVTSLVSAACAPAAPPNPTPAPAKPTTAPAAKATEAPAAKPVATASGGAKPAATSATKPAASGDWQADWDRTVAAAKPEGKVVISGGTGETYRKAVNEFSKSYPEITVEYHAQGSSEFVPKILAEREGAQYLWDLALAGVTSGVQLRERGTLDPIKPLLVRPDVLENSQWLGGFDSGFTDKDHRLFYNFESRLQYIAYVNRDMAGRSELNTIEGLVDPKWKGKISMFDPRGSGSGVMAHLLVTKGEDWLRKLLSQDVVVYRDGRQVAESIVRGRTPIAMGIQAADLANFKQEGLLGNIEALEPDNEFGATLTAGFGTLMLINRPAHPNAAKVFANWLLSAEGQKAYVAATSLNSRRLDVQGPADTAPRPNVNYVNSATEEYAQYRERGADIAKELIK